MRTCLVTGGAGFIGSHIVEALLVRGDNVRVLDNLCTGFRANLFDNVEFIEGDLSDPRAVAHAVKGVDCVFHQAALASVPLSVERPLDTNAACVTGTLTLLDQDHRAGARRLVYAASSAAYGDRPYSAKRETDLPMILSSYETVCLRYFNVFGPRQDPGSPYSAVIPLFLTAMLSGDPPQVFGDGLQSRDFTFVTNVVHGNLLAADAVGAAGQTLNIADGRQTNLLQLIRLLNEQLGINIQPDHLPARPGDVRESLADISQARSVLGYEPQVDFETGLQQSIEYYRSIASQ